MLRVTLGPGLYVVRRSSKTWPVAHVAVLVVGNQLGVEWWGSAAARLLEFDSNGLRFDEYDSNAGWIVDGRIRDHRGAIDRLTKMLERPPESYDLFANNCEHMVTTVATGIRESPQVRAALGVFVGCTLAFAIGRAIANAA